jgi:hypothetical protein
LVVVVEEPELILMGMLQPEAVPEDISLPQLILLQQGHIP